MSSDRARKPPQPPSAACFALATIGAVPTTAGLACALAGSACRETSEAATRIDAEVRRKLLKRARRQGITNECEAVKLAETWKRAAKPTRRLS